MLRISNDRAVRLILLGLSLVTGATVFARAEAVGRTRRWVGGLEPLRSTSTAGVECHLYEGHTVVTEAREGLAGERVLVKRGALRDNGRCLNQKESGDVEVAEEATYFFGFRSPWVFFDEGTAPPPRGLIVYDLDKGEEVFKDFYSPPILFLPEGALSYWRHAGEATVDNCPDMEEILDRGFGAAIEQKVSMDLSDFSFVRSTETRCVPVQ